MHPHDQPTAADAQGRRRRAVLLYGGLGAMAMLSPRIRDRLARRMPRATAHTVTLGVATLLGWTTVGVLERRHPFRRDWNRSRGDVGPDILFLLLSDSAGRLGADVVTAGLRRRLRTRAGAGRLRRLPLAGRVAAVLAVYELGHYVMHRTMHERAGWSIHAVHHRPDRLYLGNATRFHALELFIDGLHEGLGQAALGVDQDAHLASMVIRATFGQIQHGNIDIDSGFANRVLSTPDRHRWHHSRDPAEGNSNYGAILALWDEAFGTSFLPDRAFDAEIGT